MTISLTTLKALRAAMTQGEWKPDHGGFCIDSSAYAEREVVAAQFQSDAAGIVATHAAADALIEIAEAALALNRTDGVFSPASAKLAAALAKVTL